MKIAKKLLHKMFQIKGFSLRAFSRVTTLHKNEVFH